MRQDGPRQIEIPEAIFSLSRDLWLIGEAGGNVLQLIGILQAHNRLLQDTISLPMDMEDEDRREFSRLFHERFNLAREYLREAFAAIEILLKRSV